MIIWVLDIQCYCVQTSIALVCGNCYESIIMTTITSICGHFTLHFWLDRVRAFAFLQDQPTLCQHVKVGCLYVRVTETNISKSPVIN